MTYSKKVTNWLFIGIVMLFFQIIIGGITRLTESGLSITKWEIITGTVPPFSEKDWIEEFDLYKTTPQYLEVNQGMDIKDFKFIYFWEYIHRFWARIMGLTFLFPFIWFVWKGYLDKELLKRLGIVVFLAILAATFGWIMVASGLVQRPWVNAYKLSVHLCIALAVYSTLLNTFLYAKGTVVYSGIVRHRSNVLLVLFVSILVWQIFLGGVMSGMKAAVVFPSWPDMNGEYLPSILLKYSEWNINNFNHYDTNIFMPALIHFLHRGTAYILFFIGILLGISLYKESSYNAFNGNSIILNRTGILLISVLVLQMLLGIITVMSSIGTVPVLWGVLHQGVAILLLSIVVYTIFILRNNK
ncbi:MAG: COX15/CtaA family protein [Saprospiraceae bacterium]|nr:COX15/CtaA family protein [Saprospiraceae bacterium]